MNTSNGASCSQSDVDGSQVEFGTELDTSSQRGSVFAKWVFKIGQDDASKIDCNRLYNNEVEMQELQLDRLKMEIALLKSQLANPEGNTSTLSSGDDW